MYSADVVHIHESQSSHNQLQQYVSSQPTLKPIDQFEVDQLALSQVSGCESGSIIILHLSKLETVILELGTPVSGLINHYHTFNLH